MTTINFSRYNIDGLGTIELPDGRSGTVWVSLWVDPLPLTNESMMAGREDLISAAVESGSAELHLAGEVNLKIAVSPLSARYAAIELINPDLAVPAGCELAAI